jgi:hypothetical protein
MTEEKDSRLITRINELKKITDWIVEQIKESLKWPGLTKKYQYGFMAGFSIASCEMLIKHELISREEGMLINMAVKKELEKGDYINGYM